MQLPDFAITHLFFWTYFLAASTASGYALYIGVKSYVELRKLEKRQKSFLKRCLQQTQKPSKWLLNLLTPESNECKARMSIDASER